MTEYRQSTQTQEEADLMWDQVAADEPVAVIIGLMEKVNDGHEMTEVDRDRYRMACVMLGLMVLDSEGDPGGFRPRLEGTPCDCEATRIGTSAISLDFQFADGSGFQLFVAK